MNHSVLQQTAWFNLSLQEKHSANQLNQLSLAAAKYLSTRTVRHTVAFKRFRVSAPAMDSLSSDPSRVASEIVPQELAEHIVNEALAWSSIHGLLMGDKNVQDSGKIPGLGLVHAPISLLPSPFLESHFKKAVDLAPLFNELVDRVSMDDQFLQKTLSRTRKTDTFTARLLDIHSLVIREGIKQNVRLGLHRSDYMADLNTGDLLQVEMNTISSSFAGLGSRVAQLHRHLLDRIKDHSELKLEQVPDNKAVHKFAEAMACAFKEFGDASAVVLMIVQPEERNMYDQYCLSMTLYDSYGISTIRRTLAEVHCEASFLPDGTFFIEKQAVAIVYYRAGYDPKDYPSEEEWQARADIEKSKAIKCPTISYHLAGTKKVQQELAKAGVLERFIHCEVDASKLRSCFAGLWGLESEDDLHVINEAIKNPSAYVLKPQREGGGNNLFGEDLREKLIELKQESTGDSRAAYILMQRIFPPLHKTYFVRNGKLSLQEAISELGIFSAYLRNNQGLLFNEHAGYLLRTKAATTNEGGVATGFSVLDSVYLSDGHGR